MLLELRDDHQELPHLKVCEEDFIWKCMFNNPFLLRSESVLI